MELISQGWECPRCKTMKASEHISGFIKFVNSSIDRYNLALQEMTEQDKITQDYLHKMEIGNITYQERNKLATKLVANRKERRYYKDIVEVLTPIFEYFSNAQNMKMVKGLEKVLGEVRKTERYHSNRTYTVKVPNDKK